MVPASEVAAERYWEAGFNHRIAALLGFGIHSEMKNIILVDDDVDPFDTDDLCGP